MIDTIKEIIDLEMKGWLRFFSEYETVVLFLFTFLYFLDERAPLGEATPRKIYGRKVFLYLCIFFLFVVPSQYPVPRMDGESNGVPPIWVKSKSNTAFSTDKQNLINIWLVLSEFQYWVEIGLKW